MDKSRLMKRAWSAYKTATIKFNNGQRKTAPKFSECLKWSWKVSKTSIFDGAKFNVWKTDSIVRVYFEDSSYVQFKNATGYYANHRACKGERVLDLQYATDGLAKKYQDQAYRVA